MVDAYVGEIRVFAGNFAPADWALCNGQMIPISQNPALFSVLGATYGGNGMTNFALPNLIEAVPMHAGSGPGLTPRTFGESGGTKSVTLTGSQMPAHNHAANCTSTTGTSSPEGAVWGSSKGLPGPPLYTDTATATMSAQALALTGGGQAHTNMQPYLAMNFIICLYGVFPVRG